MIRNAATTSATGEFGPATVDAYELGFKAAWFDRRLTTNLRRVSGSLFYQQIIA